MFSGETAPSGQRIGPPHPHPAAASSPGVVAAPRIAAAAVAISAS
jgi:hypothetical protein